MALASHPAPGHIFADGGYAGDKPGDAMAECEGRTIEIVRRPPGITGFVAIARRWPIERPFPWPGRGRRPAKDRERSIAAAEAWTLIAAIRRTSRQTRRKMAREFGARLPVDAVRKLLLFILNSLANQPKEWIAVGKAYQELHGFGEDPIFNQVFVRLFPVMREEMWVGSPQEGPNFTVGLAFKGQPVIRHEAKIDVIYQRHFHSWAKTIETAARKQRHLDQQRAAKEQKAQKRLEKRKSKETRREEDVKRQAKARQKREMSSLVASGKRIRSSLSKSNMSNS